MQVWNSKSSNWKKYNIQNQYHGRNMCCYLWILSYLMELYVTKIIGLELWRIPSKTWIVFTSFLEDGTSQVGIGIYKEYWEEWQTYDIKKIRSIISREYLIQYLNSSVLSLKKYVPTLLSRAQIYKNMFSPCDIPN